MKVVVILIALSLTCAYSYSQNYIEVSGSYYDSESIKKFVLEQRIDQYIIYQVTMINNQIVQKGNVDSLASFLFWKVGGQYYIKMIKRNYIFTSEKVDSIDVFSDPSLKKAGATKSEDDLKFVPHGLLPYESEIFICRQNGKNFFFELGGSHYYSDDARKASDRLKIANTLR